MNEQSITLGDIRKLIHDFGPWACHEEVFQKLSLAEIEEILDRHKLSDISLASVSGIIDALAPFADYLDRLESLTIEQVLEVIRRAQIDTRTVSDILDLAGLAEGALVQGYDDFLERVTLDQLDMVLRRHGMAEMSVRNVKQTSKIVSQAVKKGSVAKISVGDLGSLMGASGIDSLHYSTLRKIIDWIRGLVVSAAYEDPFEMVVNPPWERVTLGNIERRLATDERDILLGDIIGLLGGGFAMGYGDPYTDILETLTLPALDRLVQERRIESVTFEDIEVLVGGIQALPSYEDPFERIRWAQLDRIMGSDTLRELTAGDVAGLLTGLGAFAEYSDTFAHLSWPTVQQIAKSPAERLSIHDLIEVVRLAAGRVHYSDVLEDLPIAAALGAVTGPGQQTITIGDFRGLLERFVPLAQGYEDDFESLLDQITIRDLTR